MKKPGSLKSYNPRKSKKHIFLFNVLPVAVAAAVLLGIAGNSAFQSVDATAKTSLPNIETKKSEIKTVGGSFDILEITPNKENNPLYGTSAGGSLITQYGDGDASENNYNATTGNFGYLIAGQEPIDFDKTIGHFGLALISGEKTTDTSTDSSKYSYGNGLYNADNLSAARTTWAKKYLDALEKAGIASADDNSAPLKLNKDSSDSYYKELKPWEEDVKDEKTIDLETTETYYVNATYRENLSSGSFSASASSFVPDSNGSYVQNISLLNPLTAFSADSMQEEDISNYVFYQPGFQKVDFKTIDVEKVKTYLYAAQKIGVPLIFSKPQSSTDGNDVYSVDSLATGNFSDLLTTDEKALKKDIKNHSFYDENDYYVVTSLKNPVTGSSIKNGTAGKSLADLQKEGYYAAKLDTENPFISTQQLVIYNKGFDTAAATGYFKSSPTFFNYVGKGKGSYDLNVTGEASADDSSAYIINTRIIRYVGGYTNNNWFLKHTLDLEDSEADSLAEKVRVDSVKPEDVKADGNKDAGQFKAFDDYDLVVISDGLSLFSDTAINSDYSGLNWSVLASSLESYLNDNKPLIIGKSVLSNENISDLLKTKDEKDTYKYMDMSKKDNPYGAVYKSVYLYGDNNSNKAVASDTYIENYPENQYKESGSAFKDVYDEIEYENSLRQRKNPGTKDLIDDDINEAAAIRYIINYEQHRNTSKKSKLKVLDIEPESIISTNKADGYHYYKVNNSGVTDLHTTYTYNLSTSSDDFKNSILKFLPGYNASDVDVTTVSTRTLAGLTDDITETYDLVYIGDNRGVRKQYWDTDMNQYSDSSKASFKNSLVYYNVGDEYYAKNNSFLTLNGLLDKDYTEASETKDTYRYSGNDISAKKQKELDSFIKQRFPVIVSDGLISDTSHSKLDNVYLTILKPTASYESEKLTITVSPQIVNGDGQVVQIKNSSNQVIDPEDIVKCHYELYAKSGDKLVKLDDNDSDNGTFVLTDSEMSTYGVGAKCDSTYICKITSATIDGNTINFADPANRTIKVWYNNNQAGLWTTDNDTYENSKTSFSIPNSSSIAVSKITVDNNSRLYQTLDSYLNKDYDNVMSYSSAVSNGNSVVNYASLSSPEIKMIVPPNQYKDENNINQIGEYDGKKLKQSSKKLDFQFKIINETDINTDTTYTAKVYADLNSDGVYDPDSEEITSLTAKKVDNKGSSEGSVLPTSLRGGINDESAQRYSLSAQLPESLQGAFSWKLVIYENSDNSDLALEDCPKDSYKGISFVGLNVNDKNHRISVKILQLNSHNNYESNKENDDFRLHVKDKDGNSINPFDLEKLMTVPDVSTGKYGTYVNWFGKELTSTFIKTYYDLEIKTIDASTFNTFTNQNPNWENDYDMLILGFGDNYDGPDKDGIDKVKDFAGKGKAVLFCHDNSTYKNIDKDDSTGSKYLEYHQDYGKTFTNAFYFNTKLRSKAFMDVYGISDHFNKIGNENLGGTKYWSVCDNSGILAKGEQLSKTVQNAIKELNYSVAYKPVSGGNNNGKTTNEVQGFSDAATAHRLKLDANGNIPDNKNSDNSNSNIYDKNGDLVTNKISQVNRGQITSYPYNVNLGEFKTNTEGTDTGNTDTENNGFVYTGNSSAHMEVSYTHGQWYQLNTNADNIVVWYTVESEKGDLYGYNDCINNYYIYNCGNITYTGAGHAKCGWEVTESEAKLFVNTMIAAFRTTVTRPSAKFVESANSDTEIESTSIPVETDDTDTSGSSDKNTNSKSITDAVSKAKIYFEIVDDSIAQGKTDGIELYSKVTETKDSDGEIEYSYSDENKINWVFLHDPKNPSLWLQLDNLESGKIYYFTLPLDNCPVTNDLINNGKADIWLVPYNKVNGKTRKGDPVKLTISLDKGGLFKLG